MPRGGKNTKRKSTAAHPVRKRAKRASNAKVAAAASLITEQRDYRVDYVAPKKPKYNKALKKFQTKVFDALKQTYPTTSKIYTLGNVQTVTTAVTEQFYQIFHLKPWYCAAAVPGAGTLYNEQAQNDLYDIQTEIDGVAELANRYTIKYAELEVSIQNSQASSDINLDIYELEYMKKNDNIIQRYANLQAVLALAISATTAIGTAYDFTRFGVTPFDVPSLIRDFGVKIVKKITFVVKADDIVSYRMKDFKRHHIDGQLSGPATATQFCLQGKTKSLMIIGRGAGNDAIMGCRMSAIKRYHIVPEWGAAQDPVGGRD